MSNTLSEKIYQAAKPLPQPLALEALHFIEYLRNRAEARSDLLDLMQAQQLAMQHVWDNEDDEVWNDIETA